MRNRPLRCSARLLEDGCLFRCKLDDQHSGAHEPRRDPKIIAAVRKDLMILAFRDRGRSQQWIARFFGVSKERIQQRERRAIERLRRVEQGL
jgi:hypothetical protein